MTLQAPEVSLSDLSFGGYLPPEEFALQRFGVTVQGVARCNEAPPVCCAKDCTEGVFDDMRKSRMTLCAKGGAGRKDAPLVAPSESWHDGVSEYTCDARLMASL